MYLINRISVLLLCIWFVEDVYLETCKNYNFVGLEVKKCYVYDKLRILDHIETLSDEIEMKIRFTNDEYNLKLINSDRNILNENTILWNITLDRDNHIQSSQSNLYEAYPMLQDSQVYFDHKNSAVLRTYLLNDVYIFEGIVGPYQFFYDDNSQKYFYQKMTPTLSKQKYFEQPNEKYFNLQSTEKDLTIRLLIAGDAINIPSENKIQWIKYLLYHFTAADYIFSNFSSPNIKLSIAGLIFYSDVTERKTELTQVFLKAEDKKYFVDDNFDVAFFLSNNPKPSMDNIESTWSTAAIEKADKIPFLYNLDSSNGLDINYLSVADDIAYSIQREKYVSKFPFVLDVRGSVQNSFDLSSIWDYTPIDDSKPYPPARITTIRPYPTRHIPTFKPYPTRHIPTFKPYPTRHVPTFKPYPTRHVPTLRPYPIRPDRTPKPVTDIILPTNPSATDNSNDNNSQSPPAYTAVGASVVGLLLAVLYKFKNFFFK